MERFIEVVSKVVPLPLKDVDTDLIIPAQYLTSVSREGYGKNLFRRLRDKDPSFVLNQPRYQGAHVLLAEENFGCGSSREHAVWALMGAGFRVVIAKSFADIFASNSAKNGLLLVTLSSSDIDLLHGQCASGDVNVTVSLEAQEVRVAGGAVYPFSYDSFRRHCLLHGLDDIDYILSHRAKIAQFRATQETHRFYSTSQRR